MPNLLSRDQYGGYRHPFLVGTHYLGGVGGDSFQPFDWATTSTNNAGITLDNPRTVSV